MKKRWLIGGALVLAAVAAASAWAAIPSGNGVINACYVANAGVLRVIDAEAGKHCFAFEKPLAWNVQGPKGETGRQGPAGPPGPSSRGFISRQSGDADLKDFNQVVLASLTLPAGNYVISGKAEVRNRDDERAEVQCTLIVGTGDTVFITLAPSGMGGDRQAIALLDAASLTATTTVNLTCDAFDAAARQGRLTAVGVGTLG